MIILIGKTASGKDTIANKLISEYGFKRIVTYTTRPMRDREVDGVNYHFISDEDFYNKEKEGFFMETKVYHTNQGDWWYGTSKEDIENAERNSIIILTPAGYIDFLKMYYNKIETKAFYIHSDEKTIRKRLAKRGDDKEEINRRIKHDNEDFKYVERFVKKIENNGNANLKEIIEKKMGIKKKEKKNIYIDLDCTVWNTIKQIVKMYDEDFGYYANYKKVAWEDIKTWNFVELSCANKDCIDRYFNQKRFFDEVEMIGNAKEVIDTLKEKYNIIFVSTGYATNLRAKKEYIKEYFPYAKFIGVNLSKYPDKSKVNMSGGIMIDDRADNLYTSNADIKICFGSDYEWNKDFDSSLINHFRVYDWNKVLEILG